MEPSIVFVDASALISSFVPLDTTHQKAKKITRELQNQDVKLISSNMVMSEVLTVLSLRHGKELALEFGEYIRDGGIEIAHPGPDHFEKAWQIFKREVTKNISFTGCMSLALIELFHIPSAFTFDKQFRNRGFKVFGWKSNLNWQIHTLRYSVFQLLPLATELYT